MGDEVDVDLAQDRQFGVGIVVENKADGVHDDLLALRHLDLAEDALRGETYCIARFTCVSQGFLILQLHFGGKTK